MSTTAKALSIAADLVSNISMRLPTMVVTRSFDANQDPVITVSADATPAAGEAVMVIRVTNELNGNAKDLFGNTAANYSPHKLQLCTEANFAGVTDNVADVLTVAQLAPVLGELYSRGVTVEWYQSANATLPAVAQMTAANLRSTFTRLTWGARSSQ